MIRIYNPSPNKLVLRDDIDLDRTLTIEYKENQLIWTLKTKSPLKMFIIPIEDKYLNNLFKNLILSIKHCKIYEKDEYESFRYFINNTDKYSIAYSENGPLKAATIVNESSNVDPNSSIALIYKDIYTGSIIINFSNALSFIESPKSENKSIVMSHYDENIISRDEISFVTRTDNSIMGDFYLPYMKTFESLLNSRALKLEKKNYVC